MLELKSVKVIHPLMTLPLGSWDLNTGTRPTVSEARMARNWARYPQRRKDNVWREALVLLQVKTVVYL